VGDRQHEYFVLAPLDRGDVRKALENHSNEFVSQANASLIVPKRGASKLRPRFRMQFDQHAAA
jgi:hypothetical protein